MRDSSWLGRWATGLFWAWLIAYLMLVLLRDEFLEVLRVEPSIEPERWLTCAEAYGIEPPGMGVAT